MSNKKIVLSKMVARTGVAFGTSGVRGLVSDMTDEVCFAYTKGYMQYLQRNGLLDIGTYVAIAGDLRKSTPRIVLAISEAVVDFGCIPVYCGEIPTPAVALYGIRRSIPSMMVTGSHIPDDRNGIKFYRPDGEVLKSDEALMLAEEVSVPCGLFNEKGMFHTPKSMLSANQDARREYIQRYLNYFSSDLLQGQKIGVYEHSSVARGIIPKVLRGLGAKIVLLGRSSKFVSVDTEAIREEDVKLADAWSKEHLLNSVVSTDGDGDRPLVSDEYGKWLRGDVAGFLTGRFLGVSHMVTPVSSNSMVEKSESFQSVSRTRIGSPYVIEKMKALAIEEGVAGYEANGGFLLMSNIPNKNGRVLEALPTRDAMIVIISVLASAIQAGRTVSELLTQLPARYTASDRIKNFSNDVSGRILSSLNTDDFQNNCSSFEEMFEEIEAKVVSLDNTDGLRFMLSSGDIVHLRASGNAPELRCYTESDSLERANLLNRCCIESLEKRKHIQNKTVE